MFSLSRKACLLVCFFTIYLYTQKMKKLQLFDQNHGLSPLEKCQFCGFFKQMFSLSKKACLVYKTSEIFFLRCFFFHDLLHGNTGGYRGL